ncbi:MAG: hypothetical protein A4E48_01585 [Methanosaeta sp. PtaU1.Bin060]|jgi:hypothetical protein|nr:MAG: hypothetical protein A4E48_01585 [Methanosaeta sp. PtaU1.Bin060]
MNIVVVNDAQSKPNPHGVDARILSETDKPGIADILRLDSVVGVVEKMRIGAQTRS